MEAKRPNRPDPQPEELIITVTVKHEIDASPTLQAWLNKLIKTDDTEFNRVLNGLADGLESLANIVTTQKEK